ncbi:MAG: hypothetical protein JWR90_3412 [Marmoricola sp.]|jgi:hypothetical protein|nr:hypothetical protein [Marmoricola sp.]
MSLNFTVVINVRHQFGDTDQDIGVFAGDSANFAFDCPSVSSDQALLLFQSMGVRGEHVLEVNDVTVFGGIPETDLVLAGAGFQSGGSDVPPHTHPVTTLSLGWAGQVMLINPGVLREQGNVLRIASRGDDFVVDNVVVVFKTRRTGPVIGGVLEEP